MEEGDDEKYIHVKKQYLPPSHGRNRDNKALRLTGVRRLPPTFAQGRLKARSGRTWGNRIANALALGGAGAAGYVGGAKLGAVVGGILGTAIPIPGVGTTIGAVVGAAVGALIGGLVVDRFANNVLSGHSQKSHAHQALTSLHEKGIEFTEAEINNLKAVSDGEWRDLLRVPKWRVLGGAVGDKQRRQELREALVYQVAKHGLASAKANFNFQGKQYTSKSLMLEHLASSRTRADWMNSATLEQVQSSRKFPWLNLKFQQHRSTYRGFRVPRTDGSQSRQVQNFETHFRAFMSRTDYVSLRPKVSRSGRPFLAQGYRGEFFHKGTKLSSMELPLAPFRAIGATAYSLVRHPKRSFQRLVPLSSRSPHGFVAMCAVKCIRKPLEWCGALEAKPVNIPIDFGASSSAAGSVQDARDNLKYHAAMEMAYSSDKFHICKSTTDGQLVTRPVGALKSDANADQLSLYHGVSELKNFAIEHGDGPHGWHYEPLSAFSADRHARSLYQCLPDEIRNNLDNNGLYEDPRTGNRILLLLNTHEDPPELVISHAGTRMGPSISSRFAEDSYGNVKNFAGGVPPSVEQAISLSKYVRKSVANYNDHAFGDNEQNHIEVVDVGHSRGGLMAQSAAFANGGRAVCADSEPMGAGVRARVGMLYSQDKPAGTDVLHLSIKGDHLTDSKSASRLGTGLELLGWGMPRNAGRGIKFDSAPETLVEVGSESNKKAARLQPHAHSFYNLVYNANISDDDAADDDD